VKVRAENDARLLAAFEPLGWFGIGAVLIGVVPHGSWRSAPAPFAHDCPVTEQGRRDVDEIEAVDVAGRVDAGQEGHIAISSAAPANGRDACGRAFDLQCR
jgi:hypothetical protein